MMLGFFVFLCIDWTATVVEKWLESIGYKEEAPLFAGKIKFERSSNPYLFNFFSEKRILCVVIIDHPVNK